MRGHKVMLDADLAALYGVETRVLVQAVKRNLERFPKDFMFQLTNHELENWRSRIVMSNPGARMGLRRPPYAFTEHGALMAARPCNCLVTEDQYMMPTHHQQITQLFSITIWVGSLVVEYVWIRPEIQEGAIG